MPLFITIFLLIGLMAAAIFSMLGQWDKQKWKLTIFFIGVMLTMLAVVGIVRYRFVFAIPCMPQCIGANLQERDLRGRNLADASFVEADLRGANLAGSILQRVDFSGATLIRVNFEGADLQDASLVGANLTGVNLVGANLTNADLSGADLRQADLTGVDLTKTSLYGARLSNAQLVQVNLTGAVLVAIDLSGAMLNGARLNNADLSGATLSRADLSGAQLNNSRLAGAWLNLANLTGANLSGANLSGASLIASNLSSVNLSDSTLVGTTLVGATLDGARLIATDLTGAKIKLAELSKEELNLDPAITELNELQRGQVLVDTQLESVTFDGQTIWPTAEVGEAMSQAANIADTNVELAVKTIKVGVLLSLSGELSVSEMPILDAILLAVDEINAAGGVLGQPLEPVLEDAASNQQTFVDKARKLLKQDQVAVIFGGWTSDSRKAVLPVLQELDGLLFYPAVYEGLESSPNVFYTGAEPSQHILPAVDYLLNQGHTHIFLLGSDDLFSHTANTIIKAQLATNNYSVAGEVYVPIDQTDFSQILAQLQVTPPDAIFSTLSGDPNIHFFRQLAEASFTPTQLPVLSTSIAEEEVMEIGAQYVAGHMIAGNYYQSLSTSENFNFVTAFKASYGEDRVTSDPIEAGYISLYLWKLLVEQAKSTKLEAVRAAAATERIEFAAPEGLVRVDGKTQHLYKTARVGVIRSDGVIEEVFSSPYPIKPDPFLTQFPWANTVIEELEKQRGQ